MAKNKNNKSENKQQTNTKVKVWDLVEQTAMKGKAVGLLPDVTEERRTTHVEICKKAVEYAQKFPKIAKYIILMFLVNQGAGKNDVYEKGYRSMDTARMNQLADWYEAYKKYEIGGGSLDVIARACYAFFEKFRNPKTKKVNVIKARAAFFKALKEAEKLGKHEGDGHGDCKAMLKNLGVILKNTEVKDDEVAETEEAAPAETAIKSDTEAA